MRKAEQLSRDLCRDQARNGARHCDRFRHGTSFDGQFSGCSAGQSGKGARVHKHARTVVGCGLSVPAARNLQPRSTINRQPSTIGE